MHCKHQSRHLVYIQCRRDLADERMQRPLHAPQHLRKHGKRTRTARFARGPPSLPSQEQRRGEASSKEPVEQNSMFPQYSLISSSKAAYPFWWLPSPPIVLSYNLTKRRDPALPHTWKSTQLHYVIQRPSSIFCKGFPFPSPYPTKKARAVFYIWPNLSSCWLLQSPTQKAEVLQEGSWGHQLRFTNTLGIDRHPALRKSTLKTWVLPN